MLTTSWVPLRSGDSFYGSKHDECFGLPLFVCRMGEGGGSEWVDMDKLFLSDGLGDLVPKIDIEDGESLTFNGQKVLAWWRGGDHPGKVGLMITYNITFCDIWA